MGLLVYVVKKYGEEEMRTLVQVDTEPMGGPFEPTPERPAVLISVGPAGRRCAYDAEPQTQEAAERSGIMWKRAQQPGKVGPMADGRWLHASDSRFPTFVPVPYFDRWETPQQFGGTGGGIAIVAGSVLNFAGTIVSGGAGGDANTEALST